jgi:hypothetical protein
MHIKKLTDVPDHILNRPDNQKKLKIWRSDYNVAAWFRFQQTSYDIVRLHIQWQDDNGVQKVCVDQTTINSASLLMSGIARLKITGPIKTMSVLVETNNLSYTVDELFVQPARQLTASKKAL